MVPYPAPQIPNPKALDGEGNPIEGEPETMPDPNVKYDMNEIFALINCTTANLRELADDIGTFQARITNAKEKEQFMKNALKTNIKHATRPKML